MTSSPSLFQARRRAQSRRQPDLAISSHHRKQVAKKAKRKETKRAK